MVKSNVRQATAKVAITIHRVDHSARRSDSRLKASYPGIAHGVFRRADFRSRPESRAGLAPGCSTGPVFSPVMVGTLSNKED